jgi:hypothetical protein
MSGRTVSAWSTPRLTANSTVPSPHPANHAVVFENDHVRVLETVVPVGSKAPLHSHLLRHVMIVRSGGDFVRPDAADKVLLDTRTAQPPFEWPPYLWSDGIGPHTIENVGDTDISVIAVEVNG